MNNRPLYENLDTSFVNLSALVRYLRHREFVGQIKIELNNYQAEIVLVEGNKLRVREHDKISGRVAEGEEAFQRILIRAREVGGTIHVFQEVGKVLEVKAVKEVKKIAEVQKVKIAAVPNVTNESPAPIPKPVEPIPKPAIAAQTQNGSATKVVKISDVAKKPVPIANHPKFPFDLGNKSDKKTRNTQLSAQDWQNLLALTGELLGTIDESLATAKLDFKLAFSKARSEISADYPFLHPSANNFDYKAGKVTMQEQVNAKLFVTSIIESLRRILDKLGTNPKFAEVYRQTVQKILAVINQRKPLYDRFSITPKLQKVLGV